MGWHGNRKWVTRAPKWVEGAKVIKLHASWNAVTQISLPRFRHVWVILPLASPPGIFQPHRVLRKGVLWAWSFTQWWAELLWVTAASSWDCWPTQFDSRPAADPISPCLQQRCLLIITTRANVAAHPSVKKKLAKLKKYLTNYFPKVKCHSLFLISVSCCSIAL